MMKITYWQMKQINCWDYTIYIYIRHLVDDMISDTMYSVAKMCLSVFLNIVSEKSFVDPCRILILRNALLKR
jgi:hypothetical protein